MKGFSSRRGIPGNVSLSTGRMTWSGTVRISDFDRKFTCISAIAIFPPCLFAILYSNRKFVEKLTFFDLFGRTFGYTIYKKEDKKWNSCYRNLKMISPTSVR